MAPRHSVLKQHNGITPLWTLPKCWTFDSLQPTSTNTAMENGWTWPFLVDLQVPTRVISCYPQAEEAVPISALLKRNLEVPVMQTWEPGRVTKNCCKVTHWQWLYVVIVSYSIQWIGDYHHLCNWEARFSATSKMEWPCGFWRLSTWVSLVSTTWETWKVKNEFGGSLAIKRLGCKFSDVATYAILYFSKNWDDDPRCHDLYGGLESGSELGYSGVFENSNKSFSTWYDGDFYPVDPSGYD